MSESQECPSCYLPQTEFAPFLTLHTARTIPANHACSSYTTDKNDNVSCTCGTRQIQVTQERSGSESRFEAPLTTSPQTLSTNSPPPEQILTLHHETPSAKARNLMLNYQKRYHVAANLKAKTAPYGHPSRITRNRDTTAARERRRRLLKDQSPAKCVPRTQDFSRALMEYYRKMRREDPAAYAEYARNKSQKMTDRLQEKKLRLEREKKGKEDVTMALTGPVFLSGESTTVVPMAESKIAMSEQEMVAQLNGLEIVGKGVDKRVRFSEEPEMIGVSHGDGKDGDVSMD